MFSLFHVSHSFLCSYIEVAHIILISPFVSAALPRNEIGRTQKWNSAGRSYLCFSTKEMKVELEKVAYVSRIYIYYITD